MAEARDPEVLRLAETTQRLVSDAEVLYVELRVHNEALKSFLAELTSTQRRAAVFTMVQLRSELGELKGGTENLTRTVDALSEALTSLGQLESRQQKADVEIDKAKARAIANRKSIDRLDSVSEVRAEDEKRTHRLRLLVFGSIVVIIAALIAMGFVIGQYKRSQTVLARYVVTNCNIRNGLAEATFVNAQRQAALFGGLLAQQDQRGVPLNDPKRLLLQSYLDGLPSKPATINCQAYADSQFGHP